MHRTVLGLCALVLCASTANADGYGNYSSIKDAPISSFTWTGSYIGINAGYAFDGGGDIDTSGQIAINDATVADGARPARTSLDAGGFIGGAQIGYNWQMSHWVVGVEADIQGLDFEDSRTVVTTGTAFPGVRNNIFNQELEYLGTVRARLGHAFDRTMVYVTGGLAYGGVEASADFFGPQPANVRQFTGKSSDTEVGYTIGGGIEHAFGSHWTMKFEYLYYDLDDTKVAVNVIPLPMGQGVGTGYDSEFENNGHIARVGLNYKF